MAGLQGLDSNLLKTISTKFKNTDSKDMVYDRTKKIECVGTGSTNINLAIDSDRDHVGVLIKGKMTESSGLESSGKSTLLYSSAAEAKKAGWVGILIDSEGSWDAQYGAALGLEEDEKFRVFQPVTSEDTEILINMLFGLGKGNQKTKTKIDYVLWDSITATSPADLLNTEDSTGIGASKGVHARLWSNLIRKLNKIAISENVAFAFINQIRNKMDLSSQYQEKVVKTENSLAAGFSSDNGKTTTGGMAIRYFMSLRLFLQQTKRLKEERSIRGKAVTTKSRLNYIRVDVIKNKVSIPFKTATTAIQFGVGYRDELPQFDYLVELKNGTITSSTTGVYGFSYGGVELSIKGLPNLQKALFTKHRKTLEAAYVYFKKEEYTELYEVSKDIEDDLLDEDLGEDEEDLYIDTPKPKRKKRTTRNKRR